MVVMRKEQEPQRRPRREIDWCRVVNRGTAYVVIGTYAAALILCLVSLAWICLVGPFIDGYFEEEMPTMVAVHSISWGVASIAFALHVGRWVIFRDDIWPDLI
jgi:hypothetical protein